MLLKNDIICIKEKDKEEFERILWISEDLCITITMNVDKLLLNKRTINEFEKLIDEGICELYKENLGLNKLFDDYISPVSLEYRDKAYEVMKYIFEQEEEIVILMNPKKRSNIIKNAKKIFNLSTPTIYKYYRLYLQGGKFKNALLPEYCLCGAKGKVKNWTVKSGRKSYEEIVTDKKRGVVLDDYIRTKFEVSINRYYKKGDTRTLTQTYELMVLDFFSNAEDGEIKIKKEDEIPTLRQFKYFYYKNRDLEDILRGRKGNKNFDLKDRALKSCSTFEAFGPGFRFQIDATMADVYLVNRIDGKSVVGRPILYLLVDVFSRLITGFFIGFEGPSWNGSASTIYSCTEDKVELCKKYNINISYEMWPTAGLPEIILADRGEMVGPIGNKITELLKIHTENTPSFRGDAKGIIERNFKATNDNIKHWSPGAVKKDFRQRGERRYELDAIFNIDDFTSLILYSIIQRNNSCLKDYPLSEKMIKDGVKPIPTKIWEWGMKNRSGHAHNYSDDILKASLFRNGRGVITERGIRFVGESYLTNLDKENDRYIEARVKGKKSVDVLYDNRDMSVIYMLDDVENKLIPCFKKNENQFSFNKTYEEIVDYNFIKSMRSNEQEYDNLEIKTKMNDGIKKILENAKNRGKSELNTKNIKENRKLENCTIRKEQSLSKYHDSEDTLESEQEIEETNDFKEKYFSFIRERMNDREAV